MVNRLIFLAVIFFLIATNSPQVVAQKTASRQSETKPKAALSHQWFVTAQGDDANNGITIKTSFRTLKKAAAFAVAGDVVLIGNGIYTDTNKTSNNAVLPISQSGRPDAWITWKALPGHHPEIRPVGWSGISISGSYHIIEGLAIVGGNDGITLLDALNDAKKSTPNPLFNTNGVSIDGRKNSANAKPHHIIIKNCSVSKCAGGGITALEADYVTIEDCLVFDNAWYMRYAGSGITTLNNWAFDDKPGYHIIIQRNLVWNNKTQVPWETTGKLSDGNGILLDVTDLSTGATNPNADTSVSVHNATKAKPKRPEWNGRALIANNVSAYNGGSGIHTFRTRHVDIINNTTYWNGQVVGYQELFPNRSDDIVILNNIIVPRPNGKVTSDNRNTNIRWDYNLYPQAQKVFVGANDIVGEPLFENTPTHLTMGSFRLKKGSPGVNSATNDVPQSTDITGKKRPVGAGRDRGAYEQ